MIPTRAETGADAPNDPLAPRMAAIAIISQNFVLGPIFGSFGVLLGPEAERLGISPQQGALGLSLVFVSSSLLASPVGALMARYPLRWMMTLGAVLAAAAFALLGLTTSFAAYLAAYALLLGPAMSLAGMVGPSTLVTRWFRMHGGIAQGLVYLPLMVAALPLAIDAMLKTFGVSETYLVMAAAIAIVLVPLTLLIIDQPPAPGIPPSAMRANELPIDAGLTASELLRKPRFWLLAMPTAAITGAASALGALLVQMAQGWDLDSRQAALLITIMSAVGMVGSVLFGWIADRIGGIRGLVILTALLTVIWFLLAQHLPYPVLVVVIGLAGLCAAGAIPNLSRALAEAFGTASFSRSFGLATTVALPLNVAIVPLVPWVRAQAGSYVPAMLGVSGLLAIACALALYARRGGRARDAAVA